MKKLSRTVGFWNLACIGLILFVGATRASLASGEGEILDLKSPLFNQVLDPIAEFLELTREEIVLNGDASFKGVRTVYGKRGGLTCWVKVDYLDSEYGYPRIRLHKGTNDTYEFNLESTVLSGVRWNRKHSKLRIRMTDEWIVDRVIRLKYRRNGKVKVRLSRSYMGDSCIVSFDELRQAFVR